MTAAETADAARLRRRKILWTLLAASVALHLLAAVAAGLWIVIRGFERPAVPVFAAGRPAPLPPRLAEESRAAAEGAFAAPAPAPEDRIAANRPSDLALPPLPPLRPSPADPAAPAAFNSPAPGTGIGAAAGAGTGAGEGGAGFSFFGMAEPGRRIVVALDVSDSMFVRQEGAFAKIAAETGRAIGSLGGDALFDVLVFRDGSLAWKPTLVPPTDANRAEVRRWLAAIAAENRRFTASSAGAAGQGTLLFEGGGTRGDTMLRQAFSLRPDRIVVLTDGQWEAYAQTGSMRTLGATELASLVDTLQKTQGAGAPGADADAPVAIDFFFLSTARTRPGEADAARDLARRTGGRFVEVKGADLGDASAP